MIGTASNDKDDGTDNNNNNINSEMRYPSLYERSDYETDSDSDSDSEEEGTKVDLTLMEASKKMLYNIDFDVHYSTYEGDGMYSIIIISSSSLV